MPGRVPKKFLPTLLLISKLLNRRKFAFRGTTSLILQGLDMVANDIDILCLVSNLNEENDRNSLSRYITSQNKGDTLFVYDNEPPKNPKNPMVEITLAPAPNLSDAKKVVAEIRANKSLNSKKKTFFKEVVFGRFVGQMLFFYGNRNYFSELVEVVVMALETLLGIKSAQLDIKSSISPNFIEVNLTGPVNKAKDLIV